MKKTIILLLLLILLVVKAQAQCPFTTPDTICVNQDVVIENYDTTGCGTAADPRKWYYESGTVGNSPNIVKVNNTTGGRFISTIRDNNKYYSFVTRNGYLYRHKYGTSIKNNFPIEDAINVQASMISNSGGFQGVDLVFDTVWYAFIVASKIHQRGGDIVRLRFTNGIESDPEISELKIPDTLFAFTHEVEFINDNNQWYAIYGHEQDTSIVVLNFTKGLNGDSASIKPNLYNFKDPGFNKDPFSLTGISGLCSVREGGVWSILACNHSNNNTLLRFDFNDGLTNKPTVNLLGNPKGLLKKDLEDIAFVKDCEYSMAITVSDDEFKLLSYIKFDSSIKKIDTIETVSYFSAGTLDLHAISDLYNEDGIIYALVIDDNLGVSRIEFSSGGNLDGGLIDDAYVPDQFRYKAEGRYNITLVIDNDVSRTTCRTVFAMEPPGKPIAIDPDWVCAGQKINAIPAYGVNPYRARYQWTFPGDIPKTERSPVVSTTGTYIVRNAYDQCLGDTIQRRITVSDRPKAPGVVSPYYSCPENWPTNFLTATNLKPNDRIFWYADKDLLSLKKSDTVASTYSTFIPRDSLVGTYSYYVSRKPEKKDCPREISDSVLVRMVLQRPSPPTVKKDTAFCLSDKSYEPLYATGQKVRWYLTPTLDSMTAEGSTWKPLFSKGGIYKIYATYDSAGTGCRSHPGYATLTVKETPQPVMDMNPIEGCEGFFITPEFKATAISGGSISYYFDSLASNPTGPPSLKYTHGKKTEGTYNFWVVQLANGCTSIPEKLTVDINKTNPPKILAPNEHYYSCYEKGALLHLVPDSGYTKIQWYFNNQKVVGDTVFSPSNVLKGNYTYTAEQEVNGCKSYKRDTVILEILECTDTLVYFCNTKDSVNLFDIHNPALHQYKWQDNDNTQALSMGDSVVDLQTTSLHSKTREFQYYNRLVKMRVDKQRYAGLPKDTIIEGYCYQSFIPDLQYRDEGGKWYLNQTEVKPNPDLLLISGSNEVKYMIPITYACVEDVSKMTILADSLSPVITCPKAIYKTLEVGESGYVIKGTELDPIHVDDRNCDAYTLVNDFNQKSTLDSAYFSIEEKSMMNYPITWLVTDNFGMTATCMTDITVATFRIPNLFTPNGDGENDTWMFQLDDQSTATVRVYNRWGVLVWDSKGSLFINWDGNDAGGKQLPSDGYMYIVSENNKTILKGTVTMMR